MIFIFLSGKLSYFFLSLCDYSDKFPKMHVLQFVRWGMPLNCIHTHYAIAFIINSISVFNHLRLKWAIKYTTRL